MRFALCNEMFEERPLPEVCAAAKRLGYDGIEIAPFTLAPSADAVTAEQRRETRQIIEDHGLETVGLHWLFLGPEGLHLTSLDDAVWARTRDYLLALVDLCAELGGKVLVLGSPKQRSLRDGQTSEGAWRRALDAFQSVMPRAAECGVALCIEPLAPTETDFVTTVEEGLRMVRDVDHPNFKVHLDVKAMCSEARPVADVIRSVPPDAIGHFHVNDANLYGPGMGDVDYAPIAEAIREVGWDRWLSVEVFKYDPDPETIARRSIEHLRRFWLD